MRLTRTSQRIAVASLVGVTGWFMVRLVQGRFERAIVSFDIYTFFYPTMIVAARSVLAGGKGLLWNPLHGCGQPFFAMGTTGLLYPPAFLSFILPPDGALYGLLFFNVTVGTVSAFYLCRELGVGVVAAWCGALAFGLSNSATEVLTSTPLVGGPFAWLPASMLFCERLMRAPTLRRALALAVTIAVALIPGHPQLVFYLYQLIVVRVLWELLTRRGAVGVRTLAMLALGLILPPFMIAVQFLPTLEVMRAGIRNADLGVQEISLLGYITLGGLRSQIAWGWDIDNPFRLMPWALAAASVLSRRRRLVVFYALVAAVSLILSTGPNGYLFNYYMRIPFVTLFKDPSRFLWVTAFGIAVLAAFGTDAVVTAVGERKPARWVAVLGLLAALGGYWFLSPDGFLVHRLWWVAGVAASTVVVAALVPRVRTLAAVGLAMAMVLDLLVYRPLPFRHLIPDSGTLFANAPLFRALRQRLTPQDRVHFAPTHGDHSFQQKTADLFGVPVLYDYEAQPSRRWASYYVRMRTGQRMTRLAEWGLVFGGFFPEGFQRRLFDLTAARYVVVTPKEDRTETLPGPPLRRIPTSSQDILVYENPAALPRAAWVPRIEVVSDAEALLDRLATGSDDLRQMALVEEAASAFRGEAGPPASGEVTFEIDDPEHVVLRVHAPRRGFLVLADQWFPGWQATVDGTAVPIARANYVFRAVEVPAGEVRVEFRYRPRSVMLGALVSAVTLLGVVAGLFAGRRRRGTVAVPAGPACVGSGVA